MSDSIDYGNMMHSAMRGLISEVLQRVADEGLPGDHHFFITFDTRHPDVEMAEWLFDRYPTDMTIVMQKWFDALSVGPDGFKVTLNFGDNIEPLSIPFDAISTFVDPSVEFGLRFENQDDTEEDGEVVELVPEDGSHEPHDEQPDDSGDEDGGKDADVVSLDEFRKP